MISEHPSAYKGRARHIDLKVYSLERVQAAQVKLVSCPTHDMTADCLTKPLPAPAFLRHRAVMLGNSPRTAPSVLSFFATVCAAK
mmetsp:Transcript_32403/g.79556  ORF Transcript_32403/g.79556 Transcript_32403/m.79556 type:complete len:85 (-) Transcript_32403:129-383(-)